MDTFQSHIPFDPVITIVVFLIGVPALVFQFMPSDVRRVVFDKERKKNLIQYLGFPLILASLLIIVGIVTEFIFTNEHDSIHDVKWIIIIIVLSIITGWIGIFVPLRFGRREMVIKSIKKEAIKSFQKKYRLKDKPIVDLVDLGMSAEVAQEQRLALEAIHEIMRHVVNHSTYNGDSLETPILKLIEIVTLNSDVRSVSNLKLVAEILQNVVLEKKQVEYTTDLQNAIKVVSILGEVALTQFEQSLEVDNVILSCVQTLDLIASGYPPLITNVSQALFEIGSLAIKYQREFVGIAALNKIINLLNSTSDPESELVADTIGLIAHFWMVKGSQREFSKQYLMDIKKYFGKSLRNAIKNSYQHWVSETQFQTADLIAQMAKSVRIKV